MTIDIFTRHEAIAAIEALFPADSLHPCNRDIGRKLLQQAQDEANNWRHESDAVLFRYAELCQAEAARQERAAAQARGFGL